MLFDLPIPPELQIDFAEVGRRGAVGLAGAPPDSRDTGGGWRLGRQSCSRGPAWPGKLPRAAPRDYRRQRGWDP